MPYPRLNTNHFAPNPRIFFELYNSWRAVFRFLFISPINLHMKSKWQSKDLDSPRYSKKSHSFRLLSNESGSSIMQVLVVVGVMSLFNLSIMTIMNRQSKSNSEFNLKTTALMIRQNVSAVLSNQNAWENTFQANKTIMSCASTTQEYCNPLEPNKKALLRLIDASGNTILDPNPTAGFTSHGEPCNQYSPTGNDDCPMRVELLWRAACSPATCSATLASAGQFKYEEFVTVHFRYSPSKNAFPLNTRNYNIFEQNRLKMGDNTSPAMICGEAGKIFVGPGKSINSQTSDEQGCIPYSAFFGAKGDPGPPGPTGPPGVCP